MKTIKLSRHTGDFAENKDTARDLRVNQIEKEIKKGNEITLDFKGVNSATQSFIHALISDVIRKYGLPVFDKIIFKNCTDRVQAVIEIVADYVQDGIFSEPTDINQVAKSITDIATRTPPRAYRSPSLRWKGKQGELF